MKLFDHLNNLTRNKKTPDFEIEEIEKSYDPFMISRFISMFEVWIPLVNIINTRKLPKEIHYKFLLNMLPQSGVSFTNYIKKKKEDDTTIEMKELLMKHFEFGTNDLEVALSILNDKQIEKILDMYRYGKVK